MEIRHIYRSGASNGLWCSVLLPLCIFVLVIKTESNLLKLLSFILLWIPIMEYFNALHGKKLQIKLSRYIVYGVFLFLICLFSTWIPLYNFSYSLLICFTAISSYNYINTLLLKNCPGSFSLGESIVITQGILYFLFDILESFNYKLNSSLETDYQKALNLLKLLLLGCLLLVYALYMIPVLKDGVLFHLACFSFAGLMMLIWSMIYEENAVIWFIEYCVQTYHRVFLFLSWIFLSAAAIFFVAWINHREGYKVSTRDRKYFHLVIDVVYISGILYDIQFLNIASGFTLGAFIVLEIYRLVEVPIIGAGIEKAFEVFLDEKDSGILILTHIYLLIGCSSSLWLSPNFVMKKEYHISLFSGILSVGIGDTFAAVGGTLLGRHKWKGSKKTIEGTICAFVAQFLCSMIFLALGHACTVLSITIVISATLVSCLLEAKTTQVDNLVLPLCTFAILSWIK